MPTTTLHLSPPVAGASRSRTPARAASPHARPRRRRLGLGLFELLISLAISAALLTATAVALDASFRAYRVNQELGDVTQRARLTMHRLLTETRPATFHEPAADQLAAFRAGVIVTSNTLVLSNDNVAGIRYVQRGNRLLREPVRRDSTNWIATADPTVLLHDVPDGEFRITLEPQRSEPAARAGLPHDQLRRATLRLTVRHTPDATSRPTTADSTGTHTQTLVSSVVPRRNAW